MSSRKTVKYNNKLNKISFLPGIILYVSGFFINLCFMCKKFNILIFFIALITISCSVDSDPKLVVLSKESGRSTSGDIYLDFEIKNKGEKPAYFVVAMVQALDDTGQEIAYREKGMGDIFPGETKSDKLEFPTLGGVMPNEFEIEMSYNIEINSINQYE